MIDPSAAGGRALSDGTWHWVAARRVAARAELTLVVDDASATCPGAGALAPGAACAGNATNVDALDDAPHELRVGELLAACVRAPPLRAPRRRRRARRAARRDAPADDAPPPPPAADDRAALAPAAAVLRARRRAALRARAAARGRGEVAAVLLRGRRRERHAHGALVLASLRAAGEDGFELRNLRHAAPPAAPAGAAPDAAEDAAGGARQYAGRARAEPSRVGDEAQAPSLSPGTRGARAGR